jgi:hypothetical protein
MTWFYWLIFIDEILHLWQDILNISSQASIFHWPRNIWRLIYFLCYLFQLYFILSCKNKIKIPHGKIWSVDFFLFLQMPPCDRFTYKISWHVSKTWLWRSYILIIFFFKNSLTLKTWIGQMQRFIFMMQKFQ